MKIYLLKNQQVLTYNFGGSHGRFYLMSSSSSSTLTGFVMKLSIPDANASLLKLASEYAVQQQI